MVKTKNKNAEQERACYSSATRAFLHWMTLCAVTGLLDDLGFGSYRMTRSVTVFVGGAVAINILTFLVYSLDKALYLIRNNVLSAVCPVPELVLLALNIVGGVPFAAFAMWLLGHKTSEADAGFRDRFISSSQVFMKIIRWVSGGIVLIFASYWIGQHEIVPRPMD